MQTPYALAIPAADDNARLCRNLTKSFLLIFSMLLLSFSLKATVTLNLKNTGCLEIKVYKKSWGIEYYQCNIAPNGAKSFYQCAFNQDWVFRKNTGEHISSYTTSNSYTQNHNVNSGGCSNGPTGCDKQLAYWNLNSCSAGSSYAEFTPNVTTPTGFATVNASIFSNIGDHSCNYGASGYGMCHAITDGCSFNNNDNNAYKFSVTIKPIAGNKATLSRLAFYESAPANYQWVSGGTGDNDPPAKYGVRVTVNGTEVYKQIDVPTSSGWSLETLDFGTDPDFTVTGETTFSFEILGYCRQGTSGYAVWDVDEIKVFGCSETYDPCGQNNFNVDCEKRINDGAWTTIADCFVSECPGSKVVLSVNPNGYPTTWTGPNGFTANTNDILVSNSVKLVNAGVYTATVNVNGCIKSKSITLEVRDTDGDNVCNENDCQPNNPAFPALPFTACNDGNPNTTNDAVTPDGCGCAGVPLDPCANLGGDTDGDGICNQNDCQPNNPAFPATPFTPCNDGNANTENDVVTADGCGCAGTPVQPVCDNVQMGGNIGFGPNCATSAISCNGNTPIIENCISPIGGTGDIEVVWLKATNNPQCLPPTSTAADIAAGLDPFWKMIPGATGLSLNPGPITERTCFLRCTRRVGCVTFIESNIIFVDVDPDCGTGNTPNCDNISVTTGSGSVTVTSLDGAPITSLQVMDAAFQPIFNCFGDCGSTKIIENLPAGYYFVSAKYYTSAYAQICEKFQKVTVQIACNDLDNDGICDNVDCQPDDAAYPATPGTACNDGNANTQNDVVTADGCGCAGTPIDPCATLGGDTDGDGICNQNDCQPNNPAFPATPGSACNDGNANTQNDVVTANGCGCAGTPIDPCVSLGGDSDGDGICNQNDCKPNNPAFPAVAGSPCNDGNANTNNDKVTADGCGCAGTPIGPNCALVPDNLNGLILMGTFNGSKYYCSSTNTNTWSQAKAAGVAAGLGGYLVIINDAAENEFVRSKIMASTVWIGLTDEVTEGSFKWVNGSSPSYTNWATGEPNNQDNNACYNADYAVLEKTGGKWKDRFGGDKYEFVIEIPCPSCADAANCPGFGNPTPNCSLVPSSLPNLILMGELNNSKYFCSNTSNNTWTQAKAAAVAAGLGGHLVIINTAEENEFVRSKIMSSTVWLGLTDEVVEGTYKWVNGIAPSYTNWASGEPNNIGLNNCTNADYAVLDKTSGQWRDRQGTDKYEFVIEIPCPNSQNLQAAFAQFDFEVLKHEEHVEMLWKHNDGEEVLTFTLEKSLNGMDFEPLNVQDSRGGRSVELYEDFDLEPATGDNHYRLRFDLVDGRTEYSDVVTINYAKLERVTIFPNPANSFAKVSLEDFIGKKDVTISLFNSFGHQVKLFQLDEVYSKYYQMDLRDVQEGHYVVWVNIPGSRPVAKQLMVGRL